MREDTRFVWEERKGKPKRGENNLTREEARSVGDESSRGERGGRCRKGLGIENEKEYLWNVVEREERKVGSVGKESKGV